MEAEDFSPTPVQPLSTSLLSLPRFWQVSATAIGLGWVTFGLCYLPAILNRPLCEVPEARVAQVAREMLANDEWVVPTLGGERRGFKPPLPYWLTAVSAKAIDRKSNLDETSMSRAVQLPSAASAAITVFAVTLLAGIAFDWSAGFASGVLLGLSWFLVRFGRLGFVDATLMCTCALAVIGAAIIVCSRKPSASVALLLGVGFGLAVLIKEPVPFLVIGGAVAAEVLLRRKWNTRKVLLFALAAVVAIVIALPWFLLLAERTDGGWAALIEERQLMWRQGHIQDDRWIFYFKKLGEAWLPWTPYLFFAGICAVCGAQKLGFMNWLQQGIERRGGRLIDMDPLSTLRFLALVCGLGLLAFYASPKQQDHYLLPLLPAFALLFGGCLSAFSKPGGPHEEQLAWCQLGFGILGALALVTSPLWFKQAEAFGITWAVAVPVSVAFFIAHFHSARQCVEGRPGRALIGPALIFLFVFTMLGFEWTKRLRTECTYAREAPALYALLGEQTSSDRLYFIGPDELLMFYLSRPVWTLHDLGGEERDIGAQRMLVVRKKDLSGRAPWVQAFVLDQQAMATTDNFKVYFMSSAVDWPARARAAPIWNRVPSSRE